MRRAVFFSVAAEIGATISMIATFRFAAELWGPSGFGEWAIARRLLAVVVPALTIGLDIALPWAIARTRGEKITDHLAAATAVVFSLGAILMPCLVIWRAEIATVAFGSDEHTALVVPVALTGVGTAVYLLYYGYLRGTMQIMHANLAHVLMYGIAPLATLLLVRTDTASVFLVLGGFSTVICLVLLGNAATRIGGLSSQWSAEIPAMVRFGGTRVAGALVFMLLSLAPASYVAAESGIVAGGIVALALSVCGMAGSLFVPLGVTLLPMAARLAAEGRLPDIRAPFRRIETIVLICGLLLAALGPLLAPLVALTLLGETSEATETLIAMAFVAAAPFIYFVSVRSLIDACTPRPLNTLNLFQATAAFAVVLAFMSSTEIETPTSAMLSYIAAMLVLAFTSWRTTRKVLAS